MQAVVNIVAIVAFGFVLLNNQDDPRRTLQNIFFEYRRFQS